MNYYEEIKKELVENEGYKRIKDYSENKHELNSYFKVGKLILEAQGGERRAKYGNGLIKEYSKKLTLELGSGYTFTSLSRMRKFYLLYRNVATVSQQLTWSHYCEILSIKDVNIINYYITIITQYNLSVRELRTKIKNKEYERLDDNTKQKLISKEENSVSDFIKNPIIINNKYNYDEISEKLLKQLILEDLDNFLLELGTGFTYIKSEYKIKLGDRYNYIDLLLFNYIYNCFIVIELKITELKAEHIGQIQKYMNYVDTNIRSINQDKTIGIIIVKRDNKFIMEYCSDERIYRATYVLI